MKFTNFIMTNNDSKLPLSETISTFIIWIHNYDNQYLPIYNYLYNFIAALTLLIIISLNQSVNLTNDAEFFAISLEFLARQINSLLISTN